MAKLPDSFFIDIRENSKHGGNLTIMPPSQEKCDNDKIHLIIDQQGGRTIVKDAYSGREIDNITNVYIIYDGGGYGPEVQITIRLKESMFIVK